MIEQQKVEDILSQHTQRESADREIVSYVGGAIGSIPIVCFIGSRMIFGMPISSMVGY
jgi:hypothetical protein